MIRRWCVVGFVALAASTLFARDGILSTNDGRTLQGDIQESSDGKSVNITVHGATVTLDRDNVTSISYADDAQADFQKKLAALGADDIKGRIDLARMELDARQYDLATAAAKDAERIDPHNPDAAILLDTIKSEQNLKTSTAVANATSQPTPEATPTTNPEPGKYLTMSDVYLIRAAELQPDDNVRVDFYNNVRQRYASSLTDPTAFNAKTPGQQAMDILQTGDQKMSKDVRIATDPRVLSEFHSRVLPRVLMGCLSCHGTSNGAGNFALYPDSRDPTIWYTDFYILQKSSFKVHSTDMFGSGPVVRQMIDRIRPEDSLLLNFGLPQSVATTPHPNTPKFSPIFHSLGDPAYLAVGKWIASLKAIAPDYGIKYELPTGPAPTTQGQ